MAITPRLPVPNAEVLTPRRGFLHTAFWTGAGLAVVGAGVALAKFCQAMPVVPQDRVQIAAGKVPRIGDPPAYVPEAKAYLVNLRPGEGGHAGLPGNAEGGLVALYQACTHLGCKLPWRPDFDFEGSQGWFRCPCHSATYTKSGLCVFGPAPRHMDTLDILPGADGAMVLLKGPIHRGKPRL
jgi:cytochrome b6-f complex iron-sulfur subunit